MTCEIIECCRFIRDNMAGMPVTAEYLRARLCHGNYAACVRYKLYKAHGKEHVPPLLHPDDVNALATILHCIREKSGSCTDKAHKLNSGSEEA